MEKTFLSHHASSWQINVFDGLKTQSPVTYTLAVGGGFVLSLFCLTVLNVRNRPGMGGLGGSVNILPSEVVIKSYGV